MFPNINPNIDSTREQYEQDFNLLVDRALSGELKKQEFATLLLELVTAALMAAYLAGGGNPAQMDSVLVDEIRISKQSVRAFADDLYRGRYTKSESNPNPPQVEKRISLWVFGLLAAFAIGQEYVTNQQRRYIWRYDPAKDHCQDCANLNGVVLTAAEWRQLGIKPQSRKLACNGYQCGCYREETTAESIGLDAARMKFRG